jgi:homoserine kinase
MTNDFFLRLPASTSNLGPGFDCFGLALKLYLTITAKPLSKSSGECRVRTTGPRENAALPTNATNLIYRAMSFTAKRESLKLPPVDLVVHNEIPLASGLGSSAAAIVGGIKLCGMLCQHELSDQTVQNYATEFEGHPDNVAASLYGGFVTSSVTSNSEVLSVKFDWPAEIRTCVVSPHNQLSTHVARAALPRSLSRADAVYNLQRTSLFTAALAKGRYELFEEAMRDRLHTRTPGSARITGSERLVGNCVEWRWAQHHCIGDSRRGVDRKKDCRLFPRSQDQIDHPHPGCRQ